MTKISDEFIQQLKQSLGSKYVYTDTEILEAYNFDGTEYHYLPDVVVEPETTEQISELMKLASVYRIPVVPGGAVVQPEMINLHLHEAVEVRWLYYLPDPAGY